MADEDWEDGEILEEGEEVEEEKETTLKQNHDDKNVNPSIAPPLKAPMSAPTTPSQRDVTAFDGGVLPTPVTKPRPLSASNAPASSNAYQADTMSRKRVYSSIQNGPSSSYPPTKAARPTPPPYHHQQREPTNSSYSNGNGVPPSSGRHGSHHDYEEQYSEDMTLKYPRQFVSSQVLLNFPYWMAHSMARSRRRLMIEDVQDLLLSVLDNDPSKRTYLSDPLSSSSSSSSSPPSRVCLVLLGNLHPKILQKYRPQLKFFNQCTSVPVSLSKLAHPKHVETCAGELIFKFPKPPIDTRTVPIEQLFSGHELTFLISHSYGWNDELILQPSGDFFRKSQPQGGKWVLDGELLHLKWFLTRRPTHNQEKPSKSEHSEEEKETYTLDILAAEDDSMHYFSTDPSAEKTYADLPTPAVLAAPTKRRNGQKETPKRIRISLIKAAAMDPPKNSEKISTTSEDDDDVEKKKKKKAFKYYALSMDELKHHGYPVDVTEEQDKLMNETDGCSRDQFVQTLPRGSSTNTSETVEEEEVYALDCEMCETDLGMELTRITVINQEMHVVYDTLVKPQSTIINYHTEFSGITPEILAKEPTKTLAQVQHDLITRFLYTDTLLVGHSLTSDLRALRLVHWFVADTAILYPHTRGFPFKTSLKWLTKTFLQKEIQTQGEHGHDSAEDAIAAMELFLLKVTRGPFYGIPELELKSAAYETLMEKVHARGKKLALLKLRQEGIEEDSDEKKPWQLFASGDLKDRQGSALMHATDSHEGVSQVVSCQGKEQLKTHLAGVLENDEVCWLEVENTESRHTAFVHEHEQWTQAQKSQCEAVDALLLEMEREVVPPQTLMVIIPQGDLSLHRYLKGMRTRSRWKDGAQEWTENMQAALSDAYSGLMDSCMFLKLKEGH